MAPGSSPPRIELAPEQVAPVTEVMNTLEQEAKKSDAALDTYVKSNLKHRVETFTREQLDFLDRKIQESAVLKNKAIEIRGVLAEARTNLQKLKESVWYNPTTWSPNTKRTATGIGIGALIAGGAFLLWKMFRKTKEVAKAGTQQVVQKTRWGMRLVWGTLLFAGIGVLGFIGLNNLSSLVGKKLDELKEKTLGELKKAADLVKEEKEKLAQELHEIRDTMRKADEATRRTLEEQSRLVQQKLQELQKKEQKLKAKIEEKSPAEGPSQDGKTQTPEQKPPIGSLDMVVWGLTKFIGNEKVPDVIFALKNRTTSEVLQCYNTSTHRIDENRLLALYSPPATATGATREEYMNAARELILLLGKNQSVLRKMQEKTGRTSPGSPDSVTFGDYLATIGGGVVMLRNGLDTLEKNGGSLEDWNPQESFEKHIREGKISVSGKLRYHIPDQLKNLPEELQEVEFREIVEYLKNEGAGLSQVKVRTLLNQSLPTEDRIGRCIQEICKKGLPEPQALLPYFHRVLPGHSWDEKNMQKNAEVVHEYMQDMTVSQALRMYMYDRMMHGGNQLEIVSGLTLTQAEILRVIRQQDKTFWGFLKPDAYTAVGRIAKKLKNPETLEEFVDELDIPPELQTQAMQMLRQYGASLGKQAAIFGIGLLREKASAYLSLWRSYPVPVSVATGMGLYTLVPPARWTMTAPLKLGQWYLKRTNPLYIKHTLLNTPKWYESVGGMARSLWAKTVEGGASQAMREAAGMKWGEITERIDMLDDATRNRLANELRKCSMRGANRTDLIRLADAVKKESTRCDPSMAVKLNELENFTRDFATNPGYGLQRRALALLVRPLRERLGSALNGWRKAAPWQRAAWVGGVGAQGLATYLDYQEIDTVKEERNRVEAQQKSIYEDLSKRLESDDRFEKVSKGKYRHRTSGVEVNLRQAKHQIAQADDIVDDRVLAQRLRTYTSGASSTLIGAMLLMGRGSLVVVGVELTIRAGINIWEQGKIRDFVVSSPPWLIAALGMQDTVGESEYDVLKTASSWMISDIVLRDRESTEKQGIRTKMLFTIFLNDLRQHAPEVREEIFAGIDAPEVTDAFFKEDFQQIILPACAAFLFRHVENDRAYWSNIKEMKIDGGYMIFPPDVTLMQVRSALRESAVLYLQHLREKRYLEYLSFRKKQEEEGTIDPLIEDIIEEMQSTSVFGKKLRDESVEMLMSNGGKTRAELLLNALTRKINAVPGERKQEKLQRNSALFVLPANSVMGLRQDIDVSKNETFLNWIDDPVLRSKLRKVFPETTDEPETETYPSLLNFKKGDLWTKWLKPPAGWETAAVIHNTRLAAKNIRAELDLPPIADNASAEATEQAITQAAIAVMAKGRKNTRFAAPTEQQTKALRQRDFTAPIFFDLQHLHNANYGSQMKLCGNIGHPRVAQEDFLSDQIVAVFLEARELQKGENFGQDVALATLIYCDVKQEEPLLRIVQQGGATSTAAGKSLAVGQAEGMSIASFLKQEGSEKVMEKVLPLVANRKKAYDEYQKQKKEKEEEWRKEKEMLDRPIRSQRQKDIERAEQTSVTFIVTTDTTLDKPVPEYRKRSGEHMVVTTYRAPPMRPKFSGPALVDPNASERRRHNLPTGTYIQQPRYVEQQTYDEDDDTLTFTASKIGNKKERTYTINTWQDGYNEDYAPEERAMILDVITTPLESQDSGSLLRIARLFPREVTVYNNVRSTKYYFVNTLIPLYKEARNKKAFLRELWFHCIRTTQKDKGLEKDNIDAIVQWFKEHESQFRSPDPTEGLEGAPELLTESNRGKKEAGELYLQSIGATRLESNGRAYYLVSRHQQIMYFAFIAGEWQWRGRNEHQWTPLGHQYQVEEGALKEWNDTATILSKSHEKEMQIMKEWKNKTIMYTGNDVHCFLPGHYTVKPFSEDGSPIHEGFTRSDGYFMWGSGNGYADFWKPGTEQTESNRLCRISFRIREGTQQRKAA